MTLNPRRISNNFRLQSLIEEELEKAKKLEVAPEGTLTITDFANLALIYLEIGQWDKVEKYALKVLSAEEGNPRSLNENKATALYALGTYKREHNFCEEALADFAQAQQFAESDWLKSNLLRNLALVYLKQQRFAEAHQYFYEGYKLVDSCGDDELRGSLPALSNYSALALGRAALSSGGDPAPSLALFDVTSRLYSTIFEERGMTDEIIRRRSHDYISHCVHRGMIICEMSEKHAAEDQSVNLQTAEQLLIEAFKSRKQNKADGQRLGDVCVWLGRVYVGLKRTEDARQAYNEALTHYQTIFSEDAQQIKDVKSLLSNLSFATVSISSLTENSALRAANPPLPTSDLQQENATPGASA